MIPGWNSIAGTHWWSNFYFWASICALILLGVAEVVSHRYSERSEELAAVEQQATKRRHDEEMARLHLEAARLAAETESARVKIADAQARAAQAQLELARFKAPRSMTPEESQNFVEAVSDCRGTELAVWAIGDTTEVSDLTSLLVRLLRQADWTVNKWTWTGGVALSGIAVTVRDGSESSVKSAAKCLVTALKDAGLTSAKLAWGSPWDSFPGMLNGPAEPSATGAPIRLVIGSKPTQ